MSCPQMTLIMRAGRLRGGRRLTRAGIISKYLLRLCCNDDVVLKNTGNVFAYLNSTQTALFWSFFVCGDDSSRLGSIRVQSWSIWINVHRNLLRIFVMFICRRNDIDSFNPCLVESLYLVSLFVIVAMVLLGIHAERLRCLYMKFFCLINLMLVAQDCHLSGGCKASGLFGETMMVLKCLHLKTYYDWSVV